MNEILRGPVLMYDDPSTVEYGTVIRDQALIAVARKADLEDHLTNVELAIADVIQSPEKYTGRDLLHLRRMAFDIKRQLGIIHLADSNLDH